MSKYPDDVRGDVFRRLEADNFDFSVEHPVDFFAVYTTNEEADLIARQYATDWKNGENFKNIETRPYDEGGMELELVKIMLVTYDNIKTFEEKLIQRTSKVHLTYIYRTCFFSKSPTSVGGVHKFWLLTHMAMIKYQKAALEMAWGSRYENFINPKIYCW